MNATTTKSILQMARGAISERADYEMTRLIENIMDPNTKAAAKRKLTITLTFTPDDDRANIGVSCTAKSTLAATNPVTTSLYITGRQDTGEVCAVENVPQVPGQVGMDGETQASAPVLKLVNGGM